MHSVLWLLIACQSGLTATQTGDDEIEDTTDDIPPVIVDEPISTAMPFGEDVPVSATVTDEGLGVLFVYLWYKGETVGDEDWDSTAMLADGDVYTAVIAGEDQSGGGMDYYIEAIDKAQNTTYAPTRGRDDPYHIRLYE